MHTTTKLVCVYYLQGTRLLVRVGKFFQVQFMGGGESFQVFGRIYAPVIIHIKTVTL